MQWRQVQSADDVHRAVDVLTAQCAPGQGPGNSRAACDRSSRQRRDDLAHCGGDRGPACDVLRREVTGSTEPTGDCRAAGDVASTQRRLRECWVGETGLYGLSWRP